MQPHLILLNDELQADDLIFCHIQLLLEPVHFLPMQAPATNIPTAMQINCIKQNIGYLPHLSSQEASVTMYIGISIPRTNIILQTPKTSIS